MKNQQQGIREFMTFNDIREDDIVDSVVIYQGTAIGITLIADNTTGVSIFLHADGTYDTMPIGG